MTERPTPLSGLGDRTDALLHYIPFLRKEVVAMDDDPQEHEDQHVKEVKKRNETADDDGR